MYSQIIEISKGQYLYKDWNGDNNEMEFIEIISEYDEIKPFQLFKVHGKYGISKDYKDIIADAVYSEICLKDFGGSDMFFRYDIVVRDYEGKEYHVYGKILLDGSVIQDNCLYQPNQHRNIEYNLVVPKEYVFICKTHGSYFFYYDKKGNYGVLTYSMGTKPLIIDRYDQAPYNAFLLEKQGYICLFKDKNCRISYCSKPERKWFLYSEALGKLRFLKGFHKTQSVEKVGKYFWLYKQDDYYGIMDPFLRTIIPPNQYIFIDCKKGIDIIIACDKYGNYGVLQIHEKEDTPFWQIDYLKPDCFFKSYEYDVLVSFDYKSIIRDGKYMFIENDFGKKCIYYIERKKIMTPFVFTNEWIVDPSTIGESLVGAHKKNYSNDNSHYDYAFLSINTGEVAIKLPLNYRIDTGFYNGRAKIGKYVDKYYEYYIDKEGEIYLIENCTYQNRTRERDWNPYYNEYSDEEIDTFYGLTDGMEGDLW